MPEPRITATGDNAGVRPYGRASSDRYAAYDPDNIPSFASQIGRGMSYVGGGLYDTARSAVGGGLGGLDDFFSGNSPEQIYQRERAESDRIYDESRRGILRDTPFSRQARITASSRAIENAPYAAAERATEEERQAQLTNMRIEEKQAAEMAAAEARAQEIAAEKLAQNNQIMAAQNESLRLAQEQQALQSGLPIGPSIPFSKKPVVSTPAGMAAAPESRSALAPDQSYISSRVDGLIGSYSKNMPTYTEAKTAGNVGTIDLRADAPVEQEMGGEDYLMQQSIAAAGRGDAQAAQLFGTLAKVSAETAKLRAETSKTKADERRGATTETKEKAEALKAYAEADKLMQDIDDSGIESISPDRLMTSAGTSSERVQRRQQAFASLLAENDPIMKNFEATAEQKAARMRELESVALKAIAEDEVSSVDFKIMDAFSQFMAKADGAKKSTGSSAKSLSSMEPNDPFKLPE